MKKISKKIQVMSLAGILSKKIQTLALAGICMLSACDNTAKFCVEGTIDGAADSMLYLEAMTLSGIERIDSAKLKADGTFRFHAAAPTNPEFYALRIAGKRINFSIDSTETVRFTASWPKFEADYTVEGSYNSDKIREISQKQAELQRTIIAIERDGSLLPGEVSDSVTAVLDRYKQLIRTDYIYNEPMQAYAYYAVCQSVTDLYSSFQLFNPLTDRTDVKCYATIATAWDGLYPDAERTKQICNLAIRGMDNTAPATPRLVEVDEAKFSEVSIIDVTLPDADGKMQSITSLKGKVVVLDFTIYSAQPSAERIRQLRQLYDRYHAQGLEIYQVSLDQDIHFWKSSVEALPWICVHETDGTAARMYNVQNLPTYFIVNRDNEIMLRSDMAEGSLEDEIKKYL